MGQLRGDHDPIQVIHGQQEDEHKMDLIQDIYRPHEGNSIMPSGPITRSWVKKLKQTLQVYVQEWIKKEERSGPNLEMLKDGNWIH